MAKRISKSAFLVFLAAALILSFAACPNPAGGSPLSSAKAITAFSLTSPASTGTIAGTGIAVTVPFGTNVTALVASFTTTGASIKVGSTVQTSGATANDFTSPVIYTVTADDGSTQAYTVTVTVAPASSKAITAFSIVSPPATGTITEATHSIAVTVPYNTNVTALVANFTTTGTSVRVGSTVQTSGSMPNDFTNPVTYTVIAADASTQDYSVTVTVAPASSKTITAFSIASPATTGTITEASHTVSVKLPYGTSASALNSLTAIFVTTGNSVTVGGTVQTSGSTVNNFANQVTYTVHAADGSTQDYFVTVSITLNPAKDITAYSILGNVGTINAANHTIAVTLPYNTSWASLVATFTTTGASVRIGAVTQVSGTTGVDFTGGSKTYTVVAADGTTQNYTVTVANALNPAKSIDSYSILGQPATFSSGGIYVKVPYNQDISHLVATFTYTGTSVTVGPTSQVSGTTPNDFTAGGYTPPAIGYNVRAADGSTVTIPVYLTLGTIDTLLPSSGITSTETWATDGANIYYAGFDGNIDKISIASPATLSTLSGVVYASGLTYYGSYLFWSDPWNQWIVTTAANLSGGLTLVAGSTTSTRIGNQDGTGIGASFNSPNGIANDGTYLYVSDAANHSIRKISIAGSVVTTLATLGSAANPAGLVCYGSYLYVTDSAQHVIEKIDKSFGTWSFLSGIAGTPGQKDGAHSVAEFYAPNVIQTDGTYLYVIDNGNGCLRRVSMADGSVVTLTTSITSYYGSPNPYYAQTAVVPQGGMVYTGGKLYFNDTYGSNPQIRMLY